MKTNKRILLLLLQKLTGKTRTELLQEKNITLTPEQRETLNTWLDQIDNHHKPLQYVIGDIPFCDLTIKVQEPILIPRPETEEWCSWLIEQLQNNQTNSLKILDLCSGTGCIALALAHALPHAHVIGVDINPQAIALANKNRIYNNIENVTFIKSNLYNKLEEKSFDLIVSNPPYISEKDYQTLEQNVRDWEDKQALVAAEDGLSIHKKIITLAPYFLREKTKQNIPRLVLEFGKGQEESIKTLLLDAQLTNITLRKDLAGIYRWASAE